MVVRLQNGMSREESRGGDSVSVDDRDLLVDELEYVPVTSCSGSGFPTAGCDYSGCIKLSVVLPMSGLHPCTHQRA